MLLQVCLMAGWVRGKHLYARLLLRSDTLNNKEAGGLCFSMKFVVLMTFKS